MSHSYWIKHFYLYQAARILLIFLLLGLSLLYFIPTLIISKHLDYTLGSVSYWDTGNWLQSGFEIALIGSKVALGTLMAIAAWVGFSSRKIGLSLIVLSLGFGIFAHDELIQKKQFIVKEGDANGNFAQKFSILGFEKNPKPFVWVRGGDDQKAIPMTLGERNYIELESVHIVPSPAQVGNQTKGNEFWVADLEVKDLRSDVQGGTTQRFLSIPVEKSLDFAGLVRFELLEIDASTVKGLFKYHQGPKTIKTLSIHQPIEIGELVWELKNIRPQQHFQVSRWQGSMEVAWIVLLFFVFAVWIVHFRGDYFGWMGILGLSFLFLLCLSSLARIQGFSQLEAVIAGWIVLSLSLRRPTLTTGLAFLGALTHYIVEYLKSPLGFFQSDLLWMAILSLCFFSMLCLHDSSAKVRKWVQIFGNCCIASVCVLMVVEAFFT